jgi:hypothetical protein
MTDHQGITNREKPKSQIAGKRTSNPRFPAKSDYFIRAKLPSILRRAGILHRRLVMLQRPMPDAMRRKLRF